MDENQNKQEQSEHLKQDHNQSTQNVDGHSDQGETNQENNSVDVLALLKKIDKALETVKENSTSEKNISTLDKAEKAVDKLAGMLESFTFSAHANQEQRDATPESPDIDMPNAMKFVHVRRRGGRVIKRQVKESVAE